MTIIIKGEAVNASENILNLIAIFAGEAAERYENDGCNALAKEADMIAREIHSALDALDFYLF